MKETMETIIKRRRGRPHSPQRSIVRTYRLLESEWAILDEIRGDLKPHQWLRKMIADRLMTNQ